MTNVPEKKRVLFVCTQNRVRSLTAEHLYRGRADLEVRSAGIASCAGVPLTQELFEWADHVFVFSKGQRQVIRDRYPDAFNTKPVVCLRLPDRFEYKSPKLVTALKKRLGPYLGTPDSTEAPLGKPRWRRAFAPSLSTNTLLRLGRSGRRRATFWSALCALGLALIGITPHIVQDDSPLTT
jgi:predicted protein tyrosine phosphatase